jgi:hypothetical protein
MNKILYSDLSNLNEWRKAKRGIKERRELISLMIDHFTKLIWRRALVAFWGFGAKPLLRIGFCGERFHPS